MATRISSIIVAAVLLGSVVQVTPADVSSVPSPPNNIQFRPTTNEKGAPVITATISEERRCTRPCGYVITCCVPKAEIEINTTVWVSNQTESGPISANVTGLTPVTEYACKAASFNAYGVGTAGSTDFQTTPEIVPTSAPTDVYISDIDTTSFRLNWHYSETPPPGVIIHFKIELYHKDSRYPSRNGKQVRDMTFDLSDSDRAPSVFSYQLMYLDPGTEYNVLISAVTSVGEGPAARIGQRTMSTVPMVIPRDVSGTISSFVSSEPPSFTISWSVRNEDRHLVSDIGGFLISCSSNRTLVESQPITISQPVFTAKLGHSFQSQFIGTLYYPNTCHSSGVSEDVECVVAAFNSQGEGKQSEATLITLSCSSDDQGMLESSFLSDARISLALLLFLLFLIATLIVAVVIVVIKARSFFFRKRKKTYSDYSSTDGNYVPMASTEGATQNHWQVRPMMGGSGLGSVPVGMVSNTGIDPPYAKIPVSENVYEEIHPQIDPAHQLPGSTHQPPGSTDNFSHGVAQEGGTMSTVSPSLPSEPSRDSSITHYIELSSPLLSGGGNEGCGVTHGNQTRLSNADSGVNMTSNDVTLKSDDLYKLAIDAQTVQFQKFPVLITELAGSEIIEEDTHDYYNTMIPLSELKHENLTGTERNEDVEFNSKIDAGESGVGIESQVSESSTARLCSTKTGDMESSQVSHNIAGGEGGGEGRGRDSNGEDLEEENTDDDGGSI